MGVLRPRQAVLSDNGLKRLSPARSVLEGGNGSGCSAAFLGVDPRLDPGEVQCVLFIEAIYER
jgi:hypothetical protein